MEREVAVAVGGGAAAQSPKGKWQWWSVPAEQGRAQALREGTSTGTAVVASLARQAQVGEQ